MSNHSFFIPSTVLDSESVVLVDVRSEEELLIGAIPQAINIPLQELPQRYHELTSYEHVIFFCQSGVRSQYATEFAQSVGFKNVYNGGGWEEFSKILNSR